jgi:hypothetical protein
MVFPRLSRVTSGISEVAPLHVGREGQQGQCNLECNSQEKRNGTVKTITCSHPRYGHGGNSRITESKIGARAAASVCGDVLRETGTTPTESEPQSFLRVHRPLNSEQSPNLELGKCDETRSHRI